MKKRTFVLVLITMLCILPLSTTADEWTIGSWDIWNHRAVNTSYAIGWNDTTSSLLFRLYPDIDPTYNIGLAIFEVFLPRNQSINYVSAYKDLDGQPILDMLKNYSIIPTQYDRQYQNGSGILEDAWYVNAYIYTFDNHSITNENKIHFDLYRIWNDTTNSPKYWQPLPASQSSFVESGDHILAEDSSVICKFVPNGNDTITDTSEPITTPTDGTIQPIMALLIGTICIAVIVVLIARKLR
jgi:hypothetical protein